MKDSWTALPNVMQYQLGQSVENMARLLIQGTNTKEIQMLDAEQGNHAASWLHRI